MDIKFKIDNLKETSAALKKLPEDVQSNVIDASWELALTASKAIRAAARSQGPQTALLAGTVGASEGLVPVVTVGGDSALPTKVSRGRHGKRFKAYQDVFGAEFGASRLKQFKPRNTSGYFIYPTVDAMAGVISAKWNEAADRAINDYGIGA